MMYPAEIVFCLEEKSARAMLEQILARLSCQIGTRYIPFEGKQDLGKQLESKLKHYQNPHAFFVVIQDQDSGDCKKLKKDLLKKVTSSGKQSQTIVRIACRELESFYLGDLAAVSQALSIKLPNQNSQKYRDPDRLSNAKYEVAPKKWTGS